MVAGSNPAPRDSAVHARQAPASGPGGWPALRKRTVTAPRCTAGFVRDNRLLYSLAEDCPAGHLEPMHQHDQAQLLYASSGIMSVTTDTNSFVVPPQRALWLPQHTPHEVACQNPVTMRTLYLEPAATAHLSATTQVIEVEDLLRALLIETMSFPEKYDETGRESMIVTLILDEIRQAQVIPLHAPIPQHPQLQRLCRAIMQDPTEDRQLDDYARIACLGRRTLTRLFRQETGMSLFDWRQEVRLLAAVSYLQTGQPITTVAYDVGYSSPSAFTVAFRKKFGAPPSRYIAD